MKLDEVYQDSFGKLFQVVEVGFDIVKLASGHTVVEIPHEVFYEHFTLHHVPDMQFMLFPKAVKKLLKGHTIARVSNQRVFRLIDDTLVTVVGDEPCITNGFSTEDILADDWVIMT